MIPGPVNGGALFAPPPIHDMLIACEIGHRSLLFQMIAGRAKYPDILMVMDLEPWRN